MMMKQYKWLLILLLGVVIAHSCTKPYNPPAVTTVPNYLVVEGTIVSDDSTIIQLSRTSKINTNTNNPELGAKLTVESDQNITYSLTELGRGMYATAPITLDPSRNYRLRINTKDGKTYLSDFVPVKNSPAIDSIGYKTNASGVQIYANTHDAAGSSKYYRYQYNETWQFHTKFVSADVSNGTKIVPRNADQMINSCFGNAHSNDIVLASSAKLSQDIIYQTPITQIALTSEKIETKYSILLKQYVLTADGFNYWQQLKQNTEQLGSIFDPQPSRLTGNIHNSADASEPVIGYISAGSVSQKRIFISNNQLPPSWLPTYPYTCEQDTALYCRSTPSGCFNEVSSYLIPVSNTTYIPTTAIVSFGGTIIGYLYSTPECVDCTIRGTKQTPSFWK